MTVRQKVKNREAVLQIASKARREGKNIGFTSGTFDLLHAGHVEYLDWARRNCDILIVAVNSDASVRSSKGDKRPIQSEQTRLTIIGALESVGYAFLFNEPSPRECINLLRPDVYIKGGDYRAEQLSSSSVLAEYGGRLLIAPMVPESSTMLTIDRIVSLHNAGGGSFDRDPSAREASRGVSRP